MVIESLIIKPHQLEKIKYLRGTKTGTRGKKVGRRKKLVGAKGQARTLMIQVDIKMPSPMTFVKVMHL